MLYPLSYEGLPYVFLLVSSSVQVPQLGVAGPRFRCPVRGETVVCESCSAHRARRTV
jgi:hypothetical protein